MISIELYVKDTITLEFNRVEFFNDEKITLTSSIQNISDISKTFTDFSETFTVTASPKNNAIFKHWYESSIDSGFNSNNKIDAYIELDTIPFRTGKIQLEGATIINGNPENYSLTFIGNLTNLKDKFAGLMLKDLTSTAYDFSYSATIVKDLVTSFAVSGDIMFPLISSDRPWNYDEGDTNDLNINSHPIRYNELFPAIKVVNILKMIETQFDVDFGITSNRSDFLNENKFRAAYLWLKNKETFTPALMQQIDFTTKGNLEDLSGVSINLTDNYYVSTSGRDLNITITPEVGYTTVPYTVKRFLNGIDWTTYTDSNGGTSTFYVRVDADSNKHSFYIETAEAFAFVFKMEAVSNPAKYATMSVQTLTGVTSVRTYFPEIKIEDFFTGILKMFNMTCFSTDGINYTLQRLEDYYADGNIIDITKYTDKDLSINMSRVKTFKKINFSYEKSESLINEGFLGINGVEYGDLVYNTGFDGDEYSVKLPFENLNFSNLEENLQVGFALKNDLQKYVPKPVIIYDYNPTALTTLSGSIHFHFATALTGNGTAYTTYKPFGQEYFDGTDTWSLNFPTQQSTLTNEVIENGLYLQNYDAYLGNIFNIKSRLITIKCMLPLSIISTIKLNDRVIIRDKRYVINKMVINFSTGETMLELINDFR